MAERAVPRRRPRPVTIEALRFERFESVLRDGTPVLVRPVEPTDKALLVAGFARLSPQSRYARFMAPLQQLSEGQVRYLTEIDYVDHFAWAAVHRDRPAEGLGVARYVRLKDEPTVAEAAITVADEVQGKGLGTLLLALIAVAARAAGITAFRAYVLEDNAPMRDLLESLGARTEHDSPGVLRLDVPLDPELLPDSPAANVLRAVAAHLFVSESRTELGGISLTRVRPSTAKPVAPRAAPKKSAPKRAASKKPAPKKAASKGSASAGSSTSKAAPSDGGRRRPAGPRTGRR